jgi:hypothetical protein
MLACAPAQAQLLSDSLVGLSSAELEALLELMVVLSAPKESMLTEGGPISWWGIISKGEVHVLKGKSVATQKVVRALAPALQSTALHSRHSA